MPGLIPYGPLEVGRGHIVEVMLKSRGAVSCAPRRWAAAQMQAPAPPHAAALRVVDCVLVLPTWHGRFSSVCGRSAFPQVQGVPGAPGLIPYGLLKSDVGTS